MTADTDCRYIALAYIERDATILLARRPAGAHQGGKWEFPGGKVEPGESLVDALQRELREELGIAVSVGEEMAVTRYRYPDRCVELHLFCCCGLQGDPRPLQADEVRWVPVDQLPSMHFPPANTALLQIVATRYHTHLLQVTEEEQL